MLFDKETETINEAVQDRFFVNSGLFLLSCGFIIAPIVMRPANKDLIALSFGFGSITSAISILYNQNHKKLDGLQKVIDNAALDDLSRIIAIKQKSNKVKTEIHAVKELAEFVEFMPDYMQDRLVVQYQLQGLLPPKVTLAGATSHNPAIAPYSAPSMPVQGEGFQIDNSWMNEEFWIESKCVTGAKRSGKTTFLAQEYYFNTQVKINNKPATVYAIDIHHDAHDQNNRWFKSLDPDLEDKLFITDPKQGLLIVRRVLAEAKRRVREKDKSGNFIKLMIDEYNTFLDMQSSDEERQEINDAIKFIEFNCRKFFIGSTIAPHNMKKQGSGLDSTVIANMCLIALSNTITDQNIPFPTDMDRKKLWQEICIIKSELPENFPARPAVVRQLGEGAMIRLLPYVDTAQFLFNVSGNQPDTSIDEPKEIQDQHKSSPNPEELYHSMLEWYVTLEDNPSLDDIKAKWLELSGITLTDKGAQHLKEIIEEM